jgi:hypothetical protein
LQESIFGDEMRELSYFSARHRNKDDDEELKEKEETKRAMKSRHQS